MSNNINNWNKEKEFENYTSIDWFDFKKFLYDNNVYGKFCKEDHTLFNYKSRKKIYHKKSYESFLRSQFYDHCNICFYRLRYRFTFGEVLMKDGIVIYV